MTNNDPSLQDLNGIDANKLEYIKGMISLAREDMKLVMLYVTLSFGIILLFLTQIPFDKILSLHLFLRILVFFGVLFLTLSALCFFLYIRHLHITQMKMTRCLASLNSFRTRELWAGESGVWKIAGAKYKAGKYLMGSGTACFVIVLFYILIYTKSTP